MKKYLILYFTLFIASSILAQTPREFTLEEAIDFGLSNHNNLKLAQSKISDAEQRIIEARAVGLPQINASIDYNYFLQLPVTILPDEFGIDPTTGQVNPNFDNEVRFGVKNSLSANLTISQQVFDYSWFTGLEAADAYKKYVAREYEATQESIRNNIRNAYLPSLLITENERILQKNKTNLERVIFETKELYKAGFVEQLDVDRLELSLANLTTQLESLSKQKTLTLNNLKYQMGMDLRQEIVLADSIQSLYIEASGEELTASVDYNNKAQYRIFELGEKLNELNVEMIRRMYYPTVSAFGNYQQIIQGDNLFNDPAIAPTSILGLSVNIPIFDGFYKKAQMERASIQLNNLRTQKRLFEEAINIQVANARVSYLNALEALENQEKNIALAEKIYNTAQTKYKEGVGSSLEITQAEQSLYQTQSNYTNALYNLLIAKINLDEALGN